MTSPQPDTPPRLVSLAVDALAGRVVVTLASVAGGRITIPLTPDGADELSVALLQAALHARGQAQ